MTARTNVPKSANKVPRRARPGADHNYVDPEGRDAFSDSDLLGKSVHDSDNETREDKRSRTMAQAEREEQEEAGAPP